MRYDQSDIESAMARMYAAKVIDALNGSNYPELYTRSILLGNNEAASLVMSNDTCMGVIFMDNKKSSFIGDFDLSPDEVSATVGDKLSPNSPIVKKFFKWSMATKNICGEIHSPKRITRITTPRGMWRHCRKIDVFMSTRMSPNTVTISFVYERTPTLFTQCGNEDYVNITATVVKGKLAVLYVFSNSTGATYSGEVLQYLFEKMEYIINRYVSKTVDFGLAIVSTPTRGNPPLTLAWGGIEKFKSFLRGDENKPQAPMTGTGGTATSNEPPVQKEQDKACDIPKEAPKADAHQILPFVMGMCASKNTISARMYVMDTDGLTLMRTHHVVMKSPLSDPSSDFQSVVLNSVHQNGQVADVRIIAAYLAEQYTSSENANSRHWHVRIFDTNHEFVCAMVMDSSGVNILPGGLFKTPVSWPFTTFYDRSSQAYRDFWSVVNKRA